MATIPLSVNPYEQAHMVLSNMLAASGSGAARAMFAPDSTSPEERQSWVDRFLGGKPGIFKDVLEAITNPMVLVGLVLTMKYPIKHASNMYRHSEFLGKALQKDAPLMRYISDFRERFHGPVAVWFDYGVARNHVTREEWSRRFTSAFSRFRERNGGQPISRPQALRIAMHIDQLDDADNPTWKLLREVDERNWLKKSPLPPISLNPAEKALADDIRRISRDMLSFVLEVPQGNEKLLVASLQKLGFDQHTIGRLKKGHFPHFEEMTPEKYREMVNSVLGHPSPDVQRRATGRASTFDRLTFRGLARREYQMLPDEKDLKAAGVWSDELAELYKRADVRHFDEKGHVRRRYTLDLARGLENYIFGMSRTYAWNTRPPGSEKSVGQLILDALPEIEKKAPLKAADLRETYLPMLLGQMRWETATQSLQWAEAKEWMANIINKLPLGKSTKDMLMGPLLKPYTPGQKKISSQLASYLYDTTLGANVVSPAKNLLQHFITTVPEIGPQYTMTGMREVAGRVGKYVDRRLKYGRAGMSPHDAFNKAFVETFPEFVNSGLDMKSVSSHERLMTFLREEEAGIQLLTRAGEKWQSVREKMMALFTNSERFNRLAAFYGGRAKAMAELPGQTVQDVFTGAPLTLRKGTNQLIEYVNDFAMQTMYRTQYSGGPLGMPYLTMKWNPLLRQFSQFPLRTLGFIASSDPGRLGRMLASSGLAYGLVQASVGVDISDALMFGAMPTTREGEGFFGRVPVPPALQLAGSAAESFIEGDMTPLLSSTPLLVPGGVQLSRMSTALGEAFARPINRKYADYDHPLPDGRVPVMSPSGQLIGYYTPTQLWAKSIGFGDVAGSREVALNQYLLGQRDRLRDYRRRYMEAAYAGDIDKARAIDADYQKAYPGMGTLRDTLKKSDIEALHLRREIPRIERLLQTLPPEQRSVFGQIVSVSLGAQGANFLGIDPTLLEKGGTVKSRAEFRSHPPRPTTLDEGFGSAQLMRQFGEQRRDELTQTGFQSLQPFG